MRYAKPVLTIDQQAELLLARGLLADRHEIVTRLRSVSYYRLSGYWFPFVTPDERFRKDTTLAAIWTRYTFDRRFRLLVIDAIERVEICLRAELVTHLAGEQGAFGYQDPLGLPNLTPVEHTRLLAQLAIEYDRSRDRFVEPVPRTSGSEHPLPPYWMLAELMSLGTLLTVFRGSPAAVKKAIAARFGITDSVLESWIKTLNVVRNICAHHGRLWSRELGVRPQIPRRDVRWRGRLLRPLRSTAVWPAGWLADPTGRHELRYWDRTAWTAHVSDAGAQSGNPV